MEIDRFFLIMEETPLVKGELILDQVCISDKNMIQELEQKGFGDIENEKLFLKPNKKRDGLNYSR